MRYGHLSLTSAQQHYIRDEMQSVAFVVVQGGKLVFEKYWGGYGPESRASSFSMAKSIVSLLVGIAIDEGKLRGVDQTLGEILPMYRGTDLAGIRIVDLLTMSSGLQYQKGYRNPLSGFAKSYYRLEKAYCCFNSDARDFARVGQLVLDGGEWKGKRLVSKEWLDRSLKPAPLFNHDGSPVDVYGYSWWLQSHGGHRIILAYGILGQFLIVVPDEHLVIVRLGRRWFWEWEARHKEDLWFYLETALAMLGG